MVHGDVLDSEMTWSEQRELADHRQLLLVDRRGFGQSPDVEGEDFEVDAADIADLLPTGAHLVGHSYGGVVSLLAAARRPDAVRSLTVVEPPAFGLVRGRSDVEAFISTVERVVEADPSPAEFLPQFLTAVGVDPGRLPDPLPPPLVRHAATQLHGRCHGRPRSPSTRWRARRSRRLSSREVTARCSTPSATCSKSGSARRAS